MSNMKKTDQFFEEVERKGLDPAFGKLSEIASDKLGAYLEDIIDDAVCEMERPVCRIRYQPIEDGPESYIFEIRKSDVEEWGFLCSYELKGDMLHFTALTQVRELIKMGYDICFA